MNFILFYFNFPEEEYFKAKGKSSKREQIKSTSAFKVFSFLFPSSSSSSFASSDLKPLHKPGLLLPHGDHASLPPRPPRPSRAPRPAPPSLRLPWRQGRRRRSQLLPRPPAQLRPPRRPPPRRRRVLRPERHLRPPRGPAHRALLRPLRRRPRLLRRRGAGQPQLWRARRRGRMVPGGALRVAPREGDPHRRSLLRRGHLRHRPRAQAAPGIGLRGSARVQPGRGGRRSSRRRASRQGETRIPAAEIEN